MVVVGTAKALLYYKRMATNSHILYGFRFFQGSAYGWACLVGRLAMSTIDETTTIDSLTSATGGNNCITIQAKLPWLYYPSGAYV